ncbi:hypothetical protein [Aurantibacter aestuarii]|uniref:Uncharacterized protein n=1 Tax=Aurantibacter aestuarii TaxID=1266046 RepID=A0A2T1N8P3_9FLAO|nr:hypothetical protein [Aurantibacter aestuarii]PSG88238.1 hypothetical protein C7H52_07995 [Aurantibacter aestuarii]
MIKNLLSILIVIIGFTTLNAQVYVGEIKHSKSIYTNKPDELKQEDFDKIKNAKIFFVYNEDVYQSSFNLEQFKTMVKNSWDVSEYEVISESEIISKVKIGDAIVYFTTSEYRSSNMAFNADKSYENTRIEFSILKEYKVKKKETLLDTFIFADIFISIGSRTSVGMVQTSVKKENQLKLHTGKFQIENYFRFINNKIKNNESFISWGDFSTSEISDLKNNDLLISYLSIMGYTIKEYIGNGYTLEQIESHHKNKTLKKYDYSFVLKQEDEISELLYEKTKNNELAYYLVMNPSRHFKVVNIFDNKGNMVFQNYQGASWMINNKDLKNLNKAIETGSF